MIQMVVFDMAGTTVDEDNIVYKTLRKAIVQAGFEVSLDAVLLHGAGKEKLDAIKDVLSSINPQIDLNTYAESIFAQFNTMLKEAYDEMDIKTFAGTTEVFDYLRGKGVKVVLNTGYNRTTATKLLSKLNWQEGIQYDLLVTASDVQRSRPHPDMIFLAMDKLNIRDARSVVKIGDSAIDIEEGKAAGCGLTMGVTTGAQTREQMAVAKPDYIIDSLSFLKTLV